MAQVRARRNVKPRSPRGATTSQAQPPPRLIKKYSNRKLYDTTSRHYITLDQIGELVRQGDNIQVMDRSTGEDLTAVTLSQVVLENERKKHGAIPESVLQQLVRGPGEALRGAVGQARAAGEDFIQRVEERVVRAPEMAIEEALERTLKRLKIPSQREFGRFERQLRELQMRVDELTRRMLPKSSRKPAARPAARTKHE